MNYSEEEIKKAFNNFKENLVINTSMERRMMNMIKKRKIAEHRRKVLLGTTSILIALFLVISSVTPVFGKEGTLPQAITGISIQKSADSFKGTLKADNDIVKKLESQNVPPTDSIIIVALLKQTNIPIDKIIEMREKENMGWGKILSELGVSATQLKNTLEQAANNLETNDEETVSNGTAADNNEEDASKVMVVKGILKNINDNKIIVNDTVVTLIDTNTIKYQGKSLPKESLSVGDELLVKAVKSKGSLNAESITVLKRSSNTKENENNSKQINKKDEENDENNEQNEKEEEQQKEFELRTTISSFENGILRVKDFDNDIIVDENTHIQQKVKGRTDSSALTTGETVQIHIRKRDDKYYAISIVVLNSSAGKEKKNKKETFKGTIESMDKDNKTFTINNCNLTFKILPSTIIIAKGKSIKLESLDKGDVVEIIGVEGNNEINVDKIIVIKQINEQTANNGSSEGGSNKKNEKGKNNGHSNGNKKHRKP